MLNNIEYWLRKKGLIIPHTLFILKNIISNCHYFMGARTHSTIAALSSYVPTISIAYSIKAFGINEEISIN